MSAFFPNAPSAFFPAPVCPRLLRAALLGLLLGFLVCLLSACSDSRPAVERLHGAWQCDAVATFERLRGRKPDAASAYDRGMMEVLEATAIAFDVEKETMTFTSLPEERLDGTFSYSIKEQGPDYAVLVINGKAEVYTVTGRNSMFAHNADDTARVFLYTRK